VNAEKILYRPKRKLVPEKSFGKPIHCCLRRVQRSSPPREKKRRKIWPKKRLSPGWSFLSGSIHSDGGFIMRGDRAKKKGGPNKTEEKHSVVRGGVRR